jgi:hypothetical protein
MLQYGPIRFRRLNHDLRLGRRLLLARSAAHPVCNWYREMAEEACRGATPVNPEGGKQARARGRGTLRCLSKG